MIDLRIVIATIISFFLAVSLLNAVTNILKGLDDKKSIGDLLISFTLLIIFVYAAIDVMHISISVLIGIIVAKILYDYLSQKENIFPKPVSVYG